MPQSTKAFLDSLAFQNLYQQKLQQLPLKLAFLDIDGTLTGDDKAVNLVRNKLADLGYVLCLATSRTEEMVMSSPQYQMSVNKYRFHRPQPNLKKDRHRYSYIAPEEHEPMAILDPEIIAGSSGTSLLLFQKDGGYLIDESYIADFNWRNQSLSLIRALLSTTPFTLGLIEDPKNYQQGFCDVAPPDYRIQLWFKTIPQKQAFLESLRLHLAGVSTNIQVIDDSNPGAKKFSVYLTPKSASKQQAIRHTVEKFSELLKTPAGQFQIIIAGDSFPDLLAGVYGAADSQTSLIIPGGSRLSPYLLDAKKTKIAGEGLTKIKKDMRKIKVVIGERDYPGTLGPQTILKYLKF